MKTKTLSKSSENIIRQAVEEWSAAMEAEDVYLAQEEKPGAVFWKGGKDRVTLLIRIYEADGTAWYNLEAGIAVVQSEDYKEIAAWLMREQENILSPVRFRVDEKYDNDGGQLVVIGARGPCDGITPTGMKDILDVVLAVAQNTQTKLAEEFEAVLILDDVAEQEKEANGREGVH